MSGGGFIDPIGGAYGPGLAPSGLGHLASNLGRHLKDGFSSVFGNQEVANGVRDLVGGIRGGTPIVGGSPGLDPGLIPEPTFGPGYRTSLPGDWDANAWRPAGAARFGDPAMGSRYADPAFGSRYAEPGYGSRLSEPGYGDPALGGSTVRQGLAQIGRGMLNGARSGAIFSGLFSVVINGFKVLKGQEVLSGAAGSVVADTASGAVSGALGAAASGVALAAATAAGLTVGLPLTLLGIAAGLGGALLGSWIFKKTGLHGGIRNGVTRLFGGSSFGNAIGREMPVGSPGGSLLGMPSRVGGMVPVNGNIGRLIPLH